MKAFKRIEGYEDYIVTIEGMVYSTKRNKFLKPQKNGVGYLQVALYNNGICKRFSIHRLVAMAFIDNPNDYPIINHKDENPSNNRVDNLEWCTYKYNTNYGTRNERVRRKNGKPKEHYAAKATIRSSFKNICKRMDWRFEDFKEIWLGDKINSNNKYYYIVKESD